jgi:hypothetical protein
MSPVYESLSTINCQLKCVVPEGVELTPVPKPRHNWGDVAVCPHPGCDRAFLLSNKKE